VTLDRLEYTRVTGPGETLSREPRRPRDAALAAMWGGHSWVQVGFQPAFGGVPRGPNPAVCDNSERKY
jgi:hypothetical protein